MKIVIQAICYALFLIILVACDSTQQPPTSTATPLPEPTATETLEPTSTLTVTPTEEVTEWLYVALGDSEPMCCGPKSYPEYYAEFIEQDLNVKVNLRNLAVNSLSSEGLLEKLETEEFRESVSEAQVVTLVITMQDLLVCPQGDRKCAEGAMVSAGENYAAILETIVELAGAEDTIIRAQTYDNPFVSRWKEQDVFDERKVTLDRWNQQIADIASEHGVLVADVYADFNGPQGDEDPGDKGYIAGDGFHNNEVGAYRMAELLRELGYAPIAP